MSDNTKKTGEKLNLLMVFTHIFYKSSTPKLLSVVLNLYFMPPCPHKICVALPNQRKMMQGEERHYYCMYVWEDVWPLSLASSPAPHVTHQLGPNVDQDRKTIKKKQNVNKRKQVLMLLGCCFPCL